MHTSAVFLTFVIFIFHGPTLGHVFGQVGTCHVVDHKMKKKGLGKLICLGTKILKIGPKLWSYGLDNQNIPIYSMHDPWSIKNKNQKNF